MSDGGRRSDRGPRGSLRELALEPDGDHRTCLAGDGEPRLVMKSMASASIQRHFGEPKFDMREPELPQGASQGPHFRDQTKTLRALR